MRIGTIVVTGLLCGFPLAAGPRKDSQDAAALFKQRCSGCHGKDGKAQGFMARRVHAADLTSSAVQQQSDTVIAEIIKNGKGKMPAFNSKLNDEQIHGLVGYIRQLAGK